MALFLASSSPYRRALLSRLGLPFEVIASDFDERQHDHLFKNDPGNCATTIAWGKATAVLGHLNGSEQESRDHWVLAADQIVWRSDEKEGRIQFHKPGTAEAAVDQLMQISGHRIVSTTGLVLLSQDRSVECDPGVTILDAREFTRVEAQAYVEKYQPLNCAGSFRMEDPGITLFENVQGDWTGGQGFPLLLVMDMLRRARLLPSLALSKDDIQALGNRPGVSRSAVVSYLGVLTTKMSYEETLADLETFGWSEPTQQAIREGVALFHCIKTP